MNIGDRLVGDFLDDPDLLESNLRDPAVMAAIKSGDFWAEAALVAYLHRPSLVAMAFRILLDAGADVNATGTPLKKTPLHFLCVSFTYEESDDFPDQPILEPEVWDLFNLLVEAGAQINQEDIKDESIAPAIRAWLERQNLISDPKIKTGEGKGGKPRTL